MEVGVSGDSWSSSGWLTVPGSGMAGTIEFCRLALLLTMVLLLPADWLRPTEEWAEPEEEARLEWVESLPP